MSNRPCILHTRRYRAVYEGLVNTLRDANALQPNQLARLKELQQSFCSCSEGTLPALGASDSGASPSLAAATPAADPAASQLTSPEQPQPPQQQPSGWHSALQGAQAQLLHLAQRQGAAAVEVMASAVQRLGGVVAGVVETSELQLVRRRAARRAIRDAEDWLYAVATPVVKRRGGARHGGPFGRPVAGRLTSTCLGRTCADSSARDACLALALPAYRATQLPTQTPLAPPPYGSAAVLDLSELLEDKLQLRRGKHRQLSAWRKRQCGRAAAADGGGGGDVATLRAAATGAGAAAAATPSVDQGLGKQGQVHAAFGDGPMDIAHGLCAMSLVGCRAEAGAAGAVGVMGRADSVQMACACEAKC